jgi:hypothetical protein
MDAVDLLFDIKRDDAELLHRFGLEVEDGFQCIITETRGLVIRRPSKS